MKWIGIPEQLLKEKNCRVGKEIISAYLCLLFCIEEKKEKLEIRISAQDQFKLWING